MADYSLEELLDAIGKTPEKESFSYGTKIDDFLIEYKIKKGVDRVPTTVLYFYYKEKFRGELSRIEFFRQLNKLELDTARTGKQRYYLIDASKIDITKEGKRLARQYEQEEKEQKRLRKVSRSKRKNDSKT